MKVVKDSDALEAALNEVSLLEQELDALGAMFLVTLLHLGEVRVPDEVSARASERSRINAVRDEEANCWVFSSYEADDE